MNYFLHSHKHFAFGLLILTILIAIPFTISILGQQQDIRQRAQDNTNISTQIAEGNIVNCTVAAEKFAMEPDEQTLLTLINQFRQQNNLPALTLSASLTRAAQWMADDMAASGNLNLHTDSAGRSYAARIGNCGYSSPATAVDIVLSSSGSAPSTVLSGWTTSAAHRPILLNSVSAITRNWQGIGVGKSNSGASPFTQRWVVTFGEVNDGGAVPTSAPLPTATLTPTPTPIIPPVTQPATTVTQPVATITQPQTSISPIPEFEARFKIAIPGIGSNTPSGQNANPTPAFINLQIDLLDPSTDQKVGNKNGDLQYESGTSTLTGVVKIGQSPYHLKVRTNNSLWKDMGIITVPNGGLSLPLSTLITGDLNQDNVLDMQDYNIFISCYGTKSCQQKQAADVNMDGKVTEVDLNIFYSGLASRKGD